MADSECSYAVGPRDPTPPSVHANGNGYQYVQLRCNGDRFTVGIHQLLLLATGEACPGGEECARPGDLECSGRGPCPWKVFSNGDWATHHGADDCIEYENGCEWYNWPDNLELLKNEDHNERSAREVARS